MHLKSRFCISIWLHSSTYFTHIHISIRFSIIVINLHFSPICSLLHMTLHPSLQNIFHLTLRHPMFLYLIINGIHLLNISFLPLLNGIIGKEVNLLLQLLNPLHQLLLLKQTHLWLRFPNLYLFPDSLPLQQLLPHLVCHLNLLPLLPIISLYGVFSSG